MFASIATVLCVGVSLVAGSPAELRQRNKGTKFAEPDPSFAVSVNLNGVTFVNKGLVGFGLIPSNFIEDTGDSLGGIGSAVAIKPGSFKQNSNGTFSGTLVTQPDRGFNVDATIDYQGRQHAIDFLLSPYYDDDNLSFSDAQKTLKLTYKSTFRYTERMNVPTTGLDALGVRAAQAGFPTNPLADPALPIPNSSFPRLSLDLEGLVLNKDGTFWVSDEYGPYIYRFEEDGQLLQVIQPPQAVLPQSSKGALTFTSDDDPDLGRAANQGFECLTVDTAGKTLYAMLQTATIQDGGDDKSTSRFTRLFAYDISSPSIVRPSLIGEWVVPLPQSSKGKTLGASEIHFISPNVFFVLARDGDGHGGDDNNSKYKQADLIDISKATNIAGSKFDSPQNPIAKKGKLDSSITPATYVGFVNFIDPTQLARFGLHNGKPADQTLIDAKWESLALAPVGDPVTPNDFFLFTVADNDFISTKGVFNGQPFNAGLDVDNQFLVFRVTLPTASSALP
ncbi:esterase-like activity of phytase-domain-containing protein [Cristinia sonorae]|uniref:Esterase-like activity of phytase-domain-containing protein n=1 Tax=Cristinia sonorae TaxID=1940300 RepID=A0A8K0XS46_9AGAR|nr:esterase-like activity of phytase-domain-containing protein [Cristinia sonorae]